MTARRFASISFLAVTILCSPAAIPSEAEEVTTRFLNALLKFDARAMTEELHPSVQALCRQTMLKTVSGEKNSTDRKEALAHYAAKSLQELEKLNDKEATVRFFESAFSTVSPGARKASLAATTTILGTVPEKELLHLLYRAETEQLEVSANVPSVVTLQKAGEHWRVINTTEMTKLRTQARKLGVR